MRNEATREARRELLERSLASPLHTVRDGAVVGLSMLRDPRSIPPLAAAAARENLVRQTKTEAAGRIRFFLGGSRDELRKEKPR